MPSVTEMATQLLTNVHFLFACTCNASLTCLLCAAQLSAGQCLSTAEAESTSLPNKHDLGEHAVIKRSVMVQGMDTYSNILYVKEQYVELSHLAHRAAVSEKYRPETCCIIGNYYSLRGHHEKVTSLPLIMHIAQHHHRLAI